MSRKTKYDYVSVALLACGVICILALGAISNDFITISPTLEQTSKILLFVVGLISLCLAAVRQEILNPSAEFIKSVVMRLLLMTIAMLFVVIHESTFGDVKNKEIIVCCLAGIACFIAYKLSKVEDKSNDELQDSAIDEAKRTPELLEDMNSLVLMPITMFDKYKVREEERKSPIFLDIFVYGFLLITALCWGYLLYYSNYNKWLDPEANAYYGELALLIGPSLLCLAIFQIALLIFVKSKANSERQRDEVEEKIAASALGVGMILNDEGLSCNIALVKDPWQMQFLMRKIKKIEELNPVMYFPWKEFSSLWVRKEKSTGLGFYELHFNKPISGRSAVPSIDKLLIIRAPLLEYENEILDFVRHHTKLAIKSDGK